MKHDAADLSTVSKGVCSHENRRVLLKSTRQNGTISRRYECKDCGHRWTEGNVGVNRLLSDEQVMEILASPLNVGNAELARRHGVSREAIRQVRCGITYSWLTNRKPHADGIRYCNSCDFYSRESGCRMQFPDFEELGPVFANECEAYVTSCDDPTA